MQSDYFTRPTRDTAWKRDGRVRGIYWRPRADGSKSWGYYADGKIHAARARQEAIDGKAKALLRRSAGLPAPDTRVLIRDLAETVRDAKRRTLKGYSFREWERALDKIILPELGHLKPTQAGPDRVALLIRDLEQRGLSGATIRSYLKPLSAIFRLAVRRGILPSSPLALLHDDERPKGVVSRDHFEWSPAAISQLLAAAEDLGRRPTARYDYHPVIATLVLTGLRIGEALALRWNDVDLVEGVLHVRHAWSREKCLTAPKTRAAVRDVPLSPGLVEVLLRAKPEDAAEDGWVFPSQTGSQPISYWSVAKRGFRRALELSSLDGNGITVHDLRHAAASLLIWHGLTPVEVAAVLGHSDATVTLRVYAHLFDRTDAEVRVRAAFDRIHSFCDASSERR